MDQGGFGSPHDDDVPPPSEAYPPPPPGSPGSWGPPAAPAGYPLPPPPGYQTGYGYPPPGGYPTGYGPPMPPAGWTSSEDRTWAMLAHLSFFVLSIIGPIVIMLTKGKESPYVRAQAVEALNFHITMLIAVIVSAILFLVIIGVFTMIAAFICGVTFTIMAAVATNRGDAYRYPVNLRLIH